MKIHKKERAVIRILVIAPVGRPRFLRWFNVTLILFWIHAPLFTVFWYMPASNASCGSVKSAVGAPNFFQFLYLAIAKRSYLTKNLFRKLHLMPTLVLPSSFFSLLAFLLLVISSNPRLHWLWTSKLLNFLKHRILHLRSCVSSTTSIHSAASANAWHPGTTVEYSKSEAKFFWVNPKFRRSRAATLLVNSPRECFTCVTRILIFLRFLSSLAAPLHPMAPSAISWQPLRTPPPTPYVQRSIDNVCTSHER